MRTFENLSSQKVTSLHVLFRFLRRLGCIGKVQTTTINADNNFPVSALNFTDRDHKSLRYSIRYDGYDPSRYEMQIEIELEKVFGAKMATDPWFTHFKF